MMMTHEIMILMMMVMKVKDVICSPSCYIYSHFSQTHKCLNVQLFPSIFILGTLNSSEQSCATKCRICTRLQCLWVAIHWSDHEGTPTKTKTENKNFWECGDAPTYVNCCIQLLPLFVILRFFAPGAMQHPCIVKGHC